MTFINTASRFTVPLLVGCLLAAPLQAAQAGKAMDKPAETQNAAEKKPDLEGVWVTTLTSLEDRRWSIEDYLCRHCTPQAYEHLTELLRNPKNADRPLKELGVEVKKYNNDYITGLLTLAALDFKSTYNPQEAPEINCKPVGFFHQTEAFLPVQIEQHDDRIVFRYEWWGAVRTIYMDGRGHPSGAMPSLMGHSIGWFDGPTLVVETTDIEPAIVASEIVDGIRHGSNARGIERYTRSADGNRMDIEITIVDPKTFRRPLVFKRAWLWAPGEELQEDKCEIRSGER